MHHRANGRIYIRQKAFGQVIKELAVALMKAPQERLRRASLVVCAAAPLGCGQFVSRAAEEKTCRYRFLDARVELGPHGVISPPWLTHECWLQANCQHMAGISCAKYCAEWENPPKRVASLRTWALPFSWVVDSALIGAILGLLLRPCVAASQH